MCAGQESSTQTETTSALLIINPKENKGKEAIFEGYSNDYIGDGYRCFDLACKQIKMSRNVRWTGKSYASGNYVSIPNYNQNAVIKITGDTRQIEEMTQEIENDPDETDNQNENTVRIYL